MIGPCSCKLNAGTKGHPAYIYKKVGSDFHFIGITHSPITDRTRNIPLAINPDPGSNEKSFVRPYKEAKHKKNFGASHEKWKLSRRDRKMISRLPNKKK